MTLPSPLSAPLDRSAIARLLPHRPPFLFLDAVTLLEPGQRAEGQLRPPLDLPGIDGHFPGDPIVPGVILIEALAQLCAVVALSAAPPGSPPAVRLAGIEGARFRRVVRPGELLCLWAEVEAVRRGVWRFQARAATEAGARVCEAQLTASGPS